MIKYLLSLDLVGGSTTSSATLPHARVPHAPLGSRSREQRLYRNDSQERGYSVGAQLAAL